MASLFHDTGMTQYNESDSDNLREKHHEFSTKVLDKYFNEYLKLITSHNRLLPVISFVCYSHCITLTELCSAPSFKKRDTIDFDQVRYSLLSFLLRIGDLLDLEEGRVNEFVISCFGSDYTQEAFNHNKRHTLVQTYNYSSQILEIEVMAENVEQYKIWSNWFEYLKNDILYANSHLQNYAIHFPLPKTIINTTEDANFDIEELRFEIDDKGGIWSILSQSIYTDEFDFVRELIQNAIDATLLKLYNDKNISLQNISPRSWKTEEKCEHIIIGYSEKNSKLMIIDQGVGMSKTDLKKFLFKVTGSGYNDIDIRGFAFPSIAQFGIGFVSCLINAKNIEINTRKQDNPLTYKVSLSADTSLAIIQDLDLKQLEGTTIMLELKHTFSYKLLLDYIKKTILFPSVGITCVNIDKLIDNSINIISPDKIEDALKNTYKFASLISQIEELQITLDSPLKSKYNSFNELKRQIYNVVEWINANKEYSKKTSDEEKFAIFKDKIKHLHSLIKKTLKKDYTFVLSVQSVKERTLFNTPNVYIDEIIKVGKFVDKEINEITSQRKQFNSSCDFIHSTAMSSEHEWKYCIILINDKFMVYDIQYLNEKVDLSQKTGIILINHDDCDFKQGIEFKSICGFLFEKGTICNSIAEFKGYSPWVNYDNNKSFVIGTSSSQFDYQDTLEEMLYDALEDSEMDIEDIIIDKYIAGEASYQIDSNFNAIYIHENEILYSENLNFPELSSAEYFFYSSELVENIKKSAYDFLNYFTSNELFLDDNNFGEKRMELDRIIHENKSIYCQDGINIPLNISELVPIGLLRISCNCTANSRIALNVTRHKYSENHTDIDNWMGTTGAYIQESMIKNITSLFNKLNIDMDSKHLLDPKALSDYFSQSAIRQLKSILKQNGL